MNGPTRGIKMNESLIVRATQEDKAHLRLKANQEGKSMSQLVRELLIRHGYIPPVADSSNEMNL